MRKLRYADTRRRLNQKKELQSALALEGARPDGATVARKTAEHPNAFRQMLDRFNSSRNLKVHAQTILLSRELL